MKRISWADYESKDCNMLLVIRAFSFVDDEKLTISAAVALLRRGFLSNIAEEKRTSCSLKVAEIFSHLTQVIWVLILYQSPIPRLQPDFLIHVKVSFA